MTVREILKMGDARLLRKAHAIEQFNTPELLQGIADMKETMLAANGAGLAAPQIGWDVQLVMFGTGQVISRYPDAAPIPFTVLINPIITPISDEEQNDWEGCLSVPDFPRLSGKQGVSRRQRSLVASRWNFFSC